MSVIVLGEQPYPWIVPYPNTPYFGALQEQEQLCWVLSPWYLHLVQWVYFVYTCAGGMHFAFWPSWTQIDFLQAWDPTCRMTSWGNVFGSCWVCHLSCDLENSGPATEVNWHLAFFILECVWFIWLEVGWKDQCSHHWHELLMIHHCTQTNHLSSCIHLKEAEVQGGDGLVQGKGGVLQAWWSGDRLQQPWP